MENSILDSLTCLGYDGPLSDGDTFSMALCGGPKSVEYTKLVHTLAEELRSLYNLEERVNFISDSNDSSSFLLELSSFLKELQCPYKSLTTGYMSSRLQTKTDRILLLDYLISELMTAKMLDMKCPEEKFPDIAVDMDESPTAKAIQEILMMLKISRPPVFITSNMLCIKIEARLKEFIQRNGCKLVGKPLYSPGDNQALTEEGARQLENTFKAMVEDYTLRRKALITRLDCTVKSFEWSYRLEDKIEAIRAAYFPKRYDLRPEPNVQLLDFLAARTWLLQAEKTANTRTTRSIHRNVKKITIGEVKTDGESGLSENAVSHIGANECNQAEENQAGAQISDTIDSQCENKHQIQEFLRCFCKQEINDCVDNQVGCNKNQELNTANESDFNSSNIKQESNFCADNQAGCIENPRLNFCNQRLDEDGFIPGYSLSNQEGLIKGEGSSFLSTETLSNMKIEEDLFTNPDLLTVEINIGKTNNLSILDLNNSIVMSLPSSKEPNGAITNYASANSNKNNSQPNTSTVEVPNNSSTDDSWTGWETGFTLSSKVTQNNWLTKGPKIIRLGFSNYEPLKLAFKDGVRIVNGRAIRLIFRFLQRQADMDQALDMSRQPLHVIQDREIDVNVNNRLFKCTITDLHYMHSELDDRLLRPDHYYLPLPQRKKKNLAQEMLTDNPTSTPAKRSLSHGGSVDEPPIKVPKIELEINQIYAGKINTTEPMTARQAEAIRCAVMHKIYKMDTSTRPRVYKWEYKNECLYVCVECTSVYSKKWFEALIDELNPWPEAQLTIKEVHANDTEEERPMIVKYIYTGDTLIFIDITKTAEYSGICQNGTIPPDDNVARYMTYNKPGPRKNRLRGCQLKRIRKWQAALEAKLDAEILKTDIDNKDFELLAIKKEPEDTDEESDLARYLFNQQVQIQTEEEIKAELMDADENDAVPSYSPPISINDGRQVVVLPPFSHYQSPQAQANTANPSTSSQVSNSDISKKRRRKHKGNKNKNINDSKGKEAVTIPQQKKSLKENYLEFLACIE